MEEDLRKRIVELEREIEVLKEDAIHDRLTGLKTRAYFERVLGIYLKSSSPKENDKRRICAITNKVSVIFFDVDHFKKINDTQGHRKGDEVLRKVADIIKSNLRKTDISCRWGGEELVVAMPGASIEDTEEKAEEIREKVSKLGVTVSAGVTTSTDQISLDDLVEMADKALYMAKEGGRNRVVVYKCPS